MNQPLNILMLGGAKRVSMGRMLVEAGRRLGCDVKLYSYELETHVPISQIATIIIGLRWNNNSILEHLHKIVNQYSIDILIPFVDGAVGVVARYCETYDDVWAPVGDSNRVEALFDKVVSADLFNQANLPTPATYVKGRPEFPLIAKPRYGSASKGIMILNNPRDFRRVMADGDAYLVQEYMGNCDEYTVDCYIDTFGQPICIVPRKRMEVVGGEVSRTMTIRDQEISKLASEAIHRLYLRGAVTLQFLRDRATARLVLMEINPRLGGGAVCSVHAGADLPTFIIKEALHMSVEPVDDWKPGTEVCRYQQEVVFYNEQ